MNALFSSALDLDELIPPSSRGRGLDPDWGYIAWEDTGCALEGPGLRTVYHIDGASHGHDPDAWHPGSAHAGSAHPGGARRVHIDTLVNEVEQYAAFLPTVHGGVTLAGGEPLIQHGFCVRFLRRLQRLGINTALATNGALAYRLDDPDLRCIDLVILELGSWALPAPSCRAGQSQHAAALAFARRLHALARPTWIRFGLAPGLTDRCDEVASLARFCGELTNVERVEILPQQLRASLARCTPPALEPVPPRGDEMLQAVRDTFRRHGSICPD